MLEAVGRQHIGQAIFVLRHRTAIDGGTAHVHAFAVGRPRRLHLELHSGLRTGGLLHVSEQTKGLFLRAAVAEIGRNIVTTVEHDFGATGKEAKHLIIIARAQSVAIVCRQSDVTIGCHAVQMLQRGDARRAIRTPHAREVLDHGLAPHRTREGVAFAAAHREGIAVGFAVDSHDCHHELIDPGAGCGRNIYRQRGGVVVGQRLFEFKDVLFAGDPTDSQRVAYALYFPSLLPVVEQHTGLPLLPGSNIDLVGHRATHILCRELKNNGIEQHHRREESPRRRGGAIDVLHFCFIAKVLNRLMMQSYDFMLHCAGI